MFEQVKSSWKHLSRSRWVSTLLPLKTDWLKFQGFRILSDEGGNQTLSGILGSHWEVLGI